MSSFQVVWEEGSFRDPAGSVFFIDNNVYRTINDDLVPLARKIINEEFFRNFVARGCIVPTMLIENRFSVPGQYILQHDKIPFIVYPYEWSFNMLKDAALLTLDILKSCLNNGYILKDGTAWNVTYHKGKMIFFDILSITEYEEGQTWDGYQQFCQEFLYPLLINAYKGIDFHQIYKGYLSGIDSSLVRDFFGLKDFFKPGILKHVILNTSLSKSKKIASTTIKNRLKLPKAALISIVGNLSKVIKSLSNSDQHSMWVNYTKKNTYEDKDENDKRSFVKTFCHSLPGNLKLIDLGCNTGNYSFIAAKSHRVISSDIDSNCIDHIYKQITLNNSNAITPLVMNLMNPSGNVGWALRERKSIFERLDVDAFLALALIHHICIANNVPLERFVQLLRNVASSGVLEWVDKKDPMAQFLLRNRRDIFPDYTWEKFEQIIKNYFVIKKSQTINNGFRKLLWVEAID